MDPILVRAWNDSARMYHYDGVKFTRKRMEVSNYSISGVFKYFMGYGPVVADKISGFWRVYIGGKEISKEKVFSAALSKFGPITKLTVVTSEKKYALIEMSWSDFFARSFDPAYDYLDERLVFGFWIHEILTLQEPKS